MGLSELEQRILRSATRAAGGLLVHFDAQPPEDAYLLVGGQRIDLTDGEVIPRLIRRGYLAQDMGRTLSLTARGRIAAEGFDRA